MFLYHLVYFSKRKPIADAGFAEIIQTAQHNNAALGITGSLLCSKDYYFQVLEGPRTALSTLLALIMNDDRHEEVVLTLFEPLDQRMFTDWTMMELALDNPTIQNLYDRYMGQVETPNMLSGHAIWDMLDSMADSILGQGMREKQT